LDDLPQLPGDDLQVPHPAHAPLRARPLHDRQLAGIRVADMADLPVDLDPHIRATAQQLLNPAGVPRALAADSPLVEQPGEAATAPALQAVELEALQHVALLELIDDLHVQPLAVLAEAGTALGVDGRDELVADGGGMQVGAPPEGVVHATVDLAAQL